MSHERIRRSCYQGGICAFATKSNITKGIKFKYLDLCESCIWAEEHRVPPFIAAVQIVKASICSWKCLLTTDVRCDRCQSIGLSNILNCVLEIRHSYESIDCSHLSGGLSDLWSTAHSIWWTQLVWTRCWTRSGTRLVSANKIASIPIQTRSIAEIVCAKY